MSANALAIARILARPHGGLNVDDGEALRRIADWLDRHSLTISGDDGAAGMTLELRLHGGDGPYRATLGELLDWWHELRGGQRMDWSKLRRVSG